MVKDSKKDYRIAETTLNPANTTESLRVTVPTSVVMAFKLKKGDRIVWEIYAERNEVLLKVKPKRGNK